MMMMRGVSQLMDQSLNLWFSWFSFQVRKETDCFRERKYENDDHGIEEEEEEEALRKVQVHPSNFSYLENLLSYMFNFGCKLIWMQNLCKWLVEEWEGERYRRYREREREEEKIILQWASHGMELEFLASYLLACNFLSFNFVSCY